MAKILIIDDNATNRKVLATLLEHEGHETIEARDGADGLAAVRAERPELVMSDILMPTMDGYEFVRQLRAEPETGGTPVIFHTAHYHEREARNLAQVCQVERVLAKPAKAAEILAAVQQVLTGAPPQPARPVDSQFDREHLRLVTNKLSESANELRAANARLAALTDLNIQLASERDPRVLLEKVCHAARDLLGARYAVLAVADPKNPGAASFATSGMEGRRGDRQSPRVDAGALGPVFSQRRSLRIFKSDGVVSDIGLPEGYPPAHAYLAAPVCSLTRSYGWICLADKVGALGFTAEDERILTTLGAQVGRIYENGRLYREIEEHAAQLQHLNRVYAVLSGINALIVRAQDRYQLLKDACRVAVEHGHFRFAWCGWSQSGEPQIRSAAWAGDSAGLAGLLSENGPLIEAVMRSQQPRICDDIANDPLLAVYRAEMLARGYQSIAAFPLVVTGRSVGCLVLATGERGFFNAQELRLLVELSGDLSFALDHIEKAERLNYLAYYDELTGLPNLTFFTGCLSILVNNAGRATRKLALIVTQIARFESIGETLGRTAADQLIRAIAGRLTRSVGEGDAVARTGPGEFAIVIPEIEDEADVVHALERWWPQWLGSGFEIKGNELRLDANAGIAIFPADGDDADTLLKHAEAALKKARANGDQYLFYTQHLSERGSEKLALESRLRRALENEEFRLYYQPKVDLETRRLAGVEALIRWLNPDDQTLVLPSQFIPLMEETGIIIDAGAWVLRQACRDYSRWLELGFKAPRVAVNVSTRQLRRSDFVRMVNDTVRADGTETGIDIEVTESLIMQDAADNIAKLVAIRDLGVQIAIDDFGTGYSSLGYLAKLPVSVLKIDRSFIVSMLDDPSVMTLVSTIISLAHTLRLEVVAEGVESEEQAKILRLVRCDQMQGYLISRPVPFEEMTALLNRDRLQ